MGGGGGGGRAEGRAGAGARVSDDSSLWWLSLPFNPECHQAVPLQCVDRLLSCCRHTCTLTQTHTRSLPG
jgi:hypothetical protein